MNNISAAIGIVQLKRFDEMSSKRKKLAMAYDDLLENNHVVKTYSKDYDSVVPHIYVVSINNPDNRDDVQRYLDKCGIQTGVHYLPNHNLSFYQEQGRASLSVTDKIFPSLLTLPLHPDMNKDDVHYIVEKLNDIL